MPQPPSREAGQQEIKRRQQPVSRDQHEQARAHYWHTQHSFQTTRSAEDDGPKRKPDGRTVDQRFFAPLHGEQLTALQYVQILTPQEWQRLQEAKLTTLSPQDPVKHLALLLEKTLGPLFYHPLKEVQPRAAEVIEGHRKQYDDREVMAEIIANGDLNPWVANPWFLDQLRVAFPVGGSGRHKTIGSEERENIIAACQKWRPICEGLNKDWFSAI